MSSVKNPALGPLPTVIFSSRWLQLPLYLGLIVAQGVYVVLFVKELSHIVSAIGIAWTDRLILGSSAVKTANGH